MGFLFSSALYLGPGQRSSYRDSHGLDGPGMETRWGRYSSPAHTGPGAHPVSYTTGPGSFPGVKRSRRGVNHPPHLAPRLKKEYSYNLLPIWAFVVFVQGKFYLSLYRHFIYVRSKYSFQPRKSPLFPQKSHVNFREMLLTCVSEQASILRGPLTLQAVRHFLLLWASL